MAISLTAVHPVARSAESSRRYPLAVSSLFGLLHGFGFAAALQDAGLPKKEIVTALLFFNAGVEASQLAFIAAVLVLIGLALVCVRKIGAGNTYGTLSRVEWLAGYVLGIPAAFWFLDRLQRFG